ncbi:MAG: EAL domain-containing protein [Rhizobiales bacterium]|nr:EAL domain-containing protein [Hyphomicrobiales bacterium]NRB12789.1 EAL domain-containing protein [Hyphomicrobiales bacterium]
MFKNKIIAVAILCSLTIFINYTFDLRFINQFFMLQKFEQVKKSASQELAIIEIDDKSIKHFESWPWPRSAYAQLINKLNAANPQMLGFDVDFSSKSIAENDILFANAIQNANFPIILSTVIIGAEELADGEIYFNENIPIDSLAEHAYLASANALLDEYGQVSEYANYAYNGRPTMGATLANNPEMLDEDIVIDYSIDPKSFQTFSFSDIVEGNFDPKDIEGKKLLIGSTSIDLGDMYTLPLYGRTPGVFVHALGYESLIADQYFTKIDKNWVLFAALLILTLLTFIHVEKKLMRALLVNVFVLITLYTTSIILHHFYKIILPDGLIYIAVLLNSAWQVFQNIKQRAMILFDQQNINSFNKAIIDQMIKDNSNGIILANNMGQILVFNKKAASIYAISDQAVSHKMNVFSFIPDSEALLAKIDNVSMDGGYNVNFIEQKIIQADGQELTLEIMLNKTKFVQSVGSNNETVNHILYNFMILDITEKLSIIAENKKSQLALIDLENNDPLTKMPNRKSFNQILAEICTEDLDENTSLMALVNLDSITEITDIYGTYFADETIQLISQKLNLLVGKNATLARFSDNIFGVIYKDLPPDEPAHYVELIQQIYHLFSKPLTLNGQEILMKVSMGIVLAPEHGNTADKLISNATQALEYARDSGTLNWFIYQEDMAKQIRAKRDIRTELQRAIENEEFVLYYQPQHDISNRKLVGFEALIRWEDPIKGLRFPDEFIPIAEEFGLITEIGELVLKMGCHDAASWPDHLTVALNVSPAQFTNADIAALSKKYLDLSGLPAHRLELEVTESIMMDDISLVVNTLKDVQKLGVKIAMDDFGTGYSSLQYLTELPFDKIKIDRSFTMNIGKSKQADALISSIVSLGHSLDKIVLAEGVETEDMIILLKAAGCQIGQGYLYSRPVPLVEVNKLIGLEMAHAVSA